MLNWTERVRNLSARTQRLKESERVYMCVREMERKRQKASGEVGLYLFMNQNGLYYIISLHHTDPTGAQVYWFSVFRLEVLCSY